MEKVGRNDPCPCGSGKKFKKCCESKMIGKKYLAQKLSHGSNLAGRVSQVSSFFQNTVSQTPTPSQKTFKASLAPPKKPSDKQEENPPEETKE